MKNWLPFIATRKPRQPFLTKLEDPSGYGRIIRKPDSEEVVKIVEHRDAAADELLVSEINSGVYVFDARMLFGALQEIGSDNAQGEYYLTDVFGICFRKGRKVCALSVECADEIRGINTPEQLREAETLLRLPDYAVKGPASLP